MKKKTFVKQVIKPKEEVSPEQERDRCYNWPKLGISLERVLAEAGNMEDVARLLREDEDYTEMYTIDEQVQRASDRIRASIRAFEKKRHVKLEIFTAYSPFEDHTDEFIPHIKKPEEMSDDINDNDEERNETTRRMG